MTESERWCATRAGRDARILAEGNDTLTPADVAYIAAFEAARTCIQEAPTGLQPGTALYTAYVGAYATAYTDTVARMARLRTAAVAARASHPVTCACAVCRAR